MCDDRCLQEGIHHSKGQGNYAEQHHIGALRQNFSLRSLILARSSCSRPCPVTNKFLAV